MRCNVCSCRHVSEERNHTLFVPLFQKNTDCKQTVKCYNTSAMTTNPAPIDISNNPELLRLAEEVEATKTPRKLTRQNKIVALLMPVDTQSKHHTNQQAIEETLALAGSWRDLD